MVFDGYLSDLVEEVWNIDLIESMFRAKGFASPQDFLAGFQTVAGVSGEMFPAGSARAGLEALLRAAMQLNPERPRVLIGSFNCKVVSAAVGNSGLAVDTFDLSDSHGRIDWEAVGAALTRQHLAVVIPHLFGIPTDFRPLLPIAERLGVFVIEDCAHTLTGRIGSAVAGDIGDAAVFSFNYDKPISLAGGGAFLVRNPALRPRAARPPPDAAEEYGQFRRMNAFLAFVRAKHRPPKIIGRIGSRLKLPPYVPPSLPFNIGPLRATVGLWLLERWKMTAAIRNANATLLMPSAGNMNWYIDAAVTPSFLKLRLLVGRDQIADATIAGHQSGFLILNSNWGNIVDAANIGNRPNAAIAATHGIEIPVHQNLSADQLSNLMELVTSLRASLRVP